MDSHTTICLTRHYEGWNEHIRKNPKVKMLHDIFGIILLEGGLKDAESLSY